MARRSASYLILSALVASCASSPPEMDPKIEEEMLRRKAAAAAVEERQDAFNNVLMNLDKSVDKYVEAIVRTGIHRADRKAQGLENFLREAVTKHFDQLVRTADDVSQPESRAIAVAALGFATRDEALDSILNAVRAPEDVVVNNAVFGLGMLRDRRTPPALIANIVEDASKPTNMRIGAAWSLFRVQESIPNPEQVYPVWLRILHSPNDIDPWIVIQALRGISRSRNPAHSTLATPLLIHPTPRVRWAAATCLGYLGNREASEDLIERLGPNESNPNVRLAARKALQALAGNVDRGYDVREWRRVFETSSGG